MELDNKGSWATVSLKDGMIFEGTIAKEAAWGLYFRIGGKDERLWLVPWSEVTRVVYKPNERF